MILIYLFIYVGSYLIIFAVLNVIRSEIMEVNSGAKKDSSAAGLTNAMDLVTSDTSTISVLDARFGVKYDGTNTTTQFKTALDYAVANKLRVVVPPFTYTVASLEFPSNLEIDFIVGSIMKLVPNSPANTRCIRITGVQNVNVTGTIEIDGSKDSITMGNEHMHGLFIYNARNISLENVYSHDCYGDNISITGGGDTDGDFSENIYMNNIRCFRAGRKNLVIEHVNQLTINSANLDNTTGGSGNLGGNSIDVEPFNYTGQNNKFFVNLGNVITKGTGNDFSCGTSMIEAEGYTVNINNLESYVLDLPNDDMINSSGEKTALFCYGITLNINNFKAYLANTITNLGGGKFTNPARAIKCQHSSIINITNAEIYGGVEDKSVINLEVGTEAKPIVTIDNLKLVSPKCFGIKIERSDLYIGRYYAEGLKENIIYCDTVSDNTIIIESLSTVNCGTNYLIRLSSGTTVSNASFIFENIKIIDIRLTKAVYLFASDNANVINRVSIGNLVGVDNNRILAFLGALSASSDFSIKSLNSSPLGSLVYVFTNPQGKVTAGSGTIAIYRGGAARNIMFIKETDGTKLGWRAL